MCTRPTYPIPFKRCIVSVSVVGACSRCHPDTDKRHREKAGRLSPLGFIDKSITLKSFQLFNELASIFLITLDAPFEMSLIRQAASLRETKPLWRVKNVAFFGLVQKFSFLHCPTDLVSPFSTAWGSPQNRTFTGVNSNFAGAVCLFRLPLSKKILGGSYVF